MRAIPIHGLFGSGMNRPLQTVWLLPYPRRLGQGVSVGNRLLDVRTGVILSRDAAIVPLKDRWKDDRIPDVDFLPSGYSGRKKNQEKVQELFPKPPSSWTAEETQTLAQVAAAPSPEEISDVSLIDSFFGFSSKNQSVVGAPQALRGLPLLHRLACDESGAGFRGSRPWTTDPFYCTLRPPLAADTSIFYAQSPADFFDIDLSKKWGEQAQAVRNSVILMETLQSYPLPAPLSSAPGIWARSARSKLSEAAHVDYALDPQVAKFLITLIVLDTYESASAEIMSYFKHKAKKDKRNAIMKTVALAVVSIVMPVVLATGISAVTTVMDAKEARDASKDMIKAAKQFEATDLAFAAEMERSAQILDYQAAQEALAELPTEEELIAMEQPGQEGELTPDLVEQAQAENKKKNTTLLIGGGLLAATAAVAFAIFK